MMAEITAQEAIRRLEARKTIFYRANRKEEWRPEYQMALELLYKQIPKKPYHTQFHTKCPVCGRRLPASENRSNYIRYCMKCGQKIDWGKRKEE